MTCAALACAIFLLGEQTPQPAGVETEAKRFRDLEWTAIPNLAGVDPAVRQEFESRFGKSAGLVDRGEPFRSGDLGDGRPSRRFVSAGQSGRWRFLCWEQGGFARSLNLAMFETAAGEARLVMLAHGTGGMRDAAGQWKGSVSELKASLKAGRLPVEDPDKYPRR